MSFMIIISNCNCSFFWLMNFMGLYKKYYSVVMLLVVTLLLLLLVCSLILSDILSRSIVLNN